MDDASQPALARGLAALAFASGLLLLVLVDAVTRAATAPPAALGDDAPLEVFSEARARAAHARVFAGSTPHPLGSAEHAAVRARLLGELEQLGCAPVVEDGIVQRSGIVALVHNVVVPPARRTHGEALLVCAHYDSVAAGPGAGDDGAGVAVMLETLRALRARPPAEARPLVFLFDDGEELGLLGAQAFVEGSAYAEDVGVVINLEARGTGGASRMFETAGANAGLVDVLQAALPHPSASSVSQEIYRRMPNDTDLSVFRRRWPGFNFAFIAGGRRYHTRLDDLAHLDRDTLQHHGENALALVRALAADPRRFGAADGDASYFDVLGRTLLAWPASASPLLAAAALAAIVLALRRALRAGHVRAREVVAGGVCALGAPLAAALVAWPADALVVRLNPGVYPWPAESAAARAFVLLAAATGALLAHALVARAGSRPLSHTYGVWTVHAFVGALVALGLPGATHLFLLGSAAAALALWCSRAAGSINVVAAAAAACVWCPFLAGVEDVFELRTLHVPTVLGLAALWSMLVTPFASALAEWPRRARLALAGVLALCALVALAATLAEPSQTRDQPQPIKLAQVQRAGEPTSTVYADGFGARDFDAWLDARGFATEAATVPGWLRRFGPMRSKASDALALAAPEWSVKSHTIEGELADDWTVGLRSVRGARQLVLRWPPGTAPRALRWRDRECSLRDAFSNRLIAAGFRAEEIEVTFAVLAKPAVAPGTSPSDSLRTYELLDIDSALHAPLAELVGALPECFEPRSEGAVTIVSRSGEL